MINYRLLNKNSGFTLIEMMIVVFIIGVIVMIAIPSWMGARERTCTKNCVSQLRQIRSAKEEWAIENKMGDSATPTMDQLLSYIKHEPQCPAGGQYTVGSVADDPICSYGSNHVVNGQ